jgi:hypothetical protein
LISDSDEDLPPPPFPFFGPSYTQVKTALESHCDLPLTLGRYSPRAIIDQHGEEFLLIRLEQACEQERQLQDQPTATGTYVPEMAWQSLRPGPVILRSDSLDTFLQELKKLWPTEELGA